MYTYFFFLSKLNNPKTDIDKATGSLRLITQLLYQSIHTNIPFLAQTQMAKKETLVWKCPILKTLELKSKEIILLKYILN